MHRLYREAGLSLRRKKRKRLVRQKCVFPAATASNQEWALDFATDALASQRHLLGAIRNEPMVAIWLKLEAILEGLKRS